ncbi:MAG: fibronectin type III domain-containing protein, partial [Flavobacterium sp.]
MKKITRWLVVLVFMIQSLQSQVLFEDFEGASFPPTGWLVADNGVGTLNSWTRTNVVDQVYQGTWSAFMTRENIGIGNISQDWLITPQVTVPTNGQLKFFTRSTLAGNQGTIYQIRVSTNANQAAQGNYVVVQQYTENELSTLYNVYEEKIIGLNAYIGQQVYIAFVMQFTQPTASLGGDRWLVDNVSVVQQCFDPIALTANNITQTSAQLQWGNPSGATQWEIEIVAQPGNPTGSGTIVNNNPFVATGLTPATQYQYYVRAICGTNNTSAWAGPFSFQTAIPGNNCASAIPIPSLPYSTTGTTQGLTSSVSGTPGTSGTCGGVTGAYLAGPDIFYSFTSPITGSINVQLTPNGNHSGVFVYNSCTNVGVSCVGGAANTGSGIRSFNFNAIAGQTYIVVISTSASAPNVSYNLVIQPFSCTPPPTNLNANNITQSSAQLTWNINGSASAWEVAVQPFGDPIPSGNGTPVTSNTFNATGLTAGTAYQFWVRTDCGNGNYSLWAGPFQFTTPFCDPVDQCTYTFRMTSTGGGWQGSRMQIRQNGVVITTIGTTFTTGVGPADVTVTLCNNLPFDLFWLEGGTNPNVVGVSIIKNSPITQTIYTKTPGSGTPGTVLYNGTVDCVNAQCLTPNNITVTGITLDSAIINWTSQGVETQWEVIVQPANLPAPLPGATGTIVNNPTFNATGLNSGTIYNVYIRAVCTNGNSPWSTATTFNTVICLPANQCNYIFRLSSAASLGWNGAVMQVRQNGIVVATLGPTFTTGAGPINISVPLCNGIPFELFWITGGNTPANVRVQVINPFNQVLYNMNTNSATQVGNVIYTAMVDCSNPACLPPTGVTVNQMGTFSATISWTPNGGVSWEVIAVPAGSPAPGSSVSGTPATSTPFVLGGLLASTNYDFYVRTICDGVNTQSVWTGPATGLTLPTCPQPINLTPVVANNDSATVQWTEVGAATQWEVVIVEAGEPISSGTSYIANNNPFTITGITPGFYEFYVRSLCGPNDLSLWSGPQSLFILSNLPACAGVTVDINTTTPGQLDLCPGETCVPITASYLETGVTNTYDISAIPFSPPFPFTGGTALNVTTDDLWSPLQPISFPFCFFGQSYNNVLVGSNGVVTFNNGIANHQPNGFCPWSIPDAPLPNTNFPIKNAIFGVFQDTNPAVNGPGALNDINYQFLGTAPCRVFIANFNEVAQFSCGVSVGMQTSQIVLYETSNVIDIYILKRTPCNTWQNGRGVVGLLNAAGNVAYVPPGRNVGNWSANNEAWRFTPNQGSNVVFSWLKDGQFFTNNTSINVCVEQTTVMTAQAVYTSCDGTQTVIENDILLNVQSPTLNVPSDVTVCDFYELPTLSFGEYYTAPGGPNGTGTLIPAGTNISSTQTIYVYGSIQSTFELCEFEDNFTVTYNPTIVDNLSNTTACNTFTLPTLTNGDYYTESGGLGTMLNAGDVINSSQIIYIFNSANGCTNESQFEITITPLVTPTFDPVADICPGASLSALPTTSLNGIVGTWSPALNNQSTTTYT